MPVCTSIYINTEEARRVAVCGKAPNRDKYPQLCVPTGGIIEVSLMAERDREGEEIIGRRNGIIVKPVQFSSQSNLLRLGTYKRRFSSIPYSSRKFSPTCTAQVSSFTRMIFYATRMVSSNSSAVIPNSPKKTAHSYEPYTPTHFRATKAMMQGEFLAKIQQVMLDDDDSNTAYICQENTGNDTTPLTKEEIISDLINNMEIWLALHRCCTSHGHITETLSNMLRCTVLQLTRKRMTDRALRLYRLLSDFGVSLGKSEVVALFSNIAYDIDSPTDRDQGKGSGLYSLVPRTKQHTAPSFNPRHPNVVSIREHKQTSFSPNYSDASPYADHLSLKNCVLSAQPPLATSSCDTKGEHCFTYNHLTNHTLNVDISNLLVRPPELTTASSPASVGTRDRSWIFRESRVLRDYWYEVAIGTMDALSFCYPLYQIDIREYNRDVSGEITSVISDCQDLDDAKHYTRSCKDVDAKPVVEHYDRVAKHSEYEATETHHLPLKPVFNNSAVDSCGDVTSPPNSISGDSSTSTSSRDSVLLPCKNVARKAISETLELNLNYTATIEPSISIFTKIKPNPIEDTPKSLVTVRDRRPIRGKDEAAFLLSLKTLGQWSTHDKGGERGHYTPPFTSSSSCKSSSMPLQISSKGGWITALQLWASKYLDAPFATGPLQPIRNNNTTNHTNNRKNNNAYAKIQVLPPLLSRNISRRAIECLFVILLAMPARIAQIHYASAAGDSEGDAPYPLPSGYPLLVEWGPLSVANAVLRAIDNTKQRELGEHTLHNLANVTGAETGGDSKVSDANIDKGDSICPSRELLANHISATPPHKTERSQNLLSVEACRLGGQICMTKNRSWSMALMFIFRGAEELKRLVDTCSDRQDDTNNTHAECTPVLLPTICNSSEVTEACNINYVMKAPQISSGSCDSKQSFEAHDIEAGNRNIEGPSKCTVLVSIQSLRNIMENRSKTPSTSRSASVREVAPIVQEARMLYTLGLEAAARGRNAVIGRIMFDAVKDDGSFTRIQGTSVNNTGVPSGRQASVEVIKELFYKSQGRSLGDGRKRRDTSDFLPSSSVKLQIDEGSSTRHGVPNLTQRAERRDCSDTSDMIPLPSLKGDDLAQRLSKMDLYWDIMLSEDSPIK